MSRLSIEVTPEQHNAIKMAALEHGFTMKEFILNKLEHELKHKPQKTIAKKPSSGALSDDCPLCEAYGGKQRKLKTRTANDMKIAGTYKTTKEMFSALGIEIGN